MLQIVTPPAAELVSLIELRAQCRLDTAEEDGLLAGYLLAAREHVETYLQRAIGTQVLELRIDGDWPSECIDGRWQPRIVLPRPPLQSVASVEYLDANGTTQTLADDQYKVLGIGDRLRDGAIVPAYGVAWPTVRQESEAIIVRFTAGYGGASPLPALPEQIRQAILLLGAHWYRHRQPVEVSDGAFVGLIAGELQRTLDALLFPFRVLPC